MDDNDDCSNEPSETYAYGLYGPLGNVPSIGDEYQAEIPSLLTNSEYLEYLQNPIEEEERKAEVPADFLIGLAIPVVWINNEYVRDNVGSTSDIPAEINDMNNDNAGSLVPGSYLEAWSEIEKSSFVLGLYIFKKNFVRLKRFLGSKKIGDIMSYYYGKFYRSDAYMRWSYCRKSRGRKCVLGQRIFSGLRQQEFLCRLAPLVSEEVQNSLLEASRALADLKKTLEQYVFFIKDLIGIEMFVDAVAIGKGKQDLTGPAIESTKENQAIQLRPEIPIGKACASLTAREIIRFLTGDYRLSKARSNDIFWEAVWPRLLERGWHSEQPNGYIYAANGKPSLVFLMPGVEKFSRKLVKGNAYFDSVPDVLNKVAKDPQLIELQNEGNGENGIKLEGEGEDEEEENRFHEKKKSHCYLQPRAPNPGNFLMKFTVVDTSLSGGRVIRVRELETTNLMSRSYSDEIHSELVSNEESDGANPFLVDQDQDNKPIKKQKTSDERKIPEKKHLKTSNGSELISAEGGRKLMKAAMSRKSRQENLGHHAKRRRRLTACSRVDSIAGSSLDSHVGSSSQANNHNHKLSSNLSFTSRCSSIDTVEEQQMNLIDLNYPHVPPEFGNGEFVTQVKVEENELELHKQSENIVGPKEQENGGSRRQSTRNRPPTTRALEAIANGFLTVNTRKKGKEDSKSRISKNSRVEVGLISEYSTGDASSAVKGDDENGEIEK